MANITNKGTRYTEAVSQARTAGPADPASSEETGMQILSPEAAAMILRPSADDIARLMNDSTLEFAPQVKSLEEGEMIQGVLEGRGPSTEFTQKDQFTGQEMTREVGTWIIRSPNGSLRMSILSSIQLMRKLPPFIGEFVKIYRGKDLKTNKGFRVTDYLVAGPKRPDGQARSWVVSEQDAAIEAEGRQIDGRAEQAQLPAGTMAGANSQPGGEDARA